MGLFYWGTGFFLVPAHIFRVPFVSTDLVIAVLLETGEWVVDTVPCSPLVTKAGAKLGHV